MSHTDLLNVLEICYSREHRFTNHLCFSRVVSTQSVDASEKYIVYEIYAGLLIRPRPRP